jgi:hypothetical protein
MSSTTLDLEKINLSIQTEIYTFLGNLSKKYNIQVETLKNLLKDQENVSIDKTKEVKEEVTVKEEVKISKTQGLVPTGKCLYRFVRAPKAGLLCGVQLRNKDNCFCSKHKMHEVDNPDKVKIPKVPKATTKKTNLPVEIPKTDIVLRLNTKIGKYIHPISGLVFFSKEIREVCGKLKNDKIVSLDEKDIENCNKFAFKIYQPRDTVDEKNLKSQKFEHDSDCKKLECDDCKELTSNESTCCSECSNCDCDSCSDNKHRHLKPLEV